MARRKGLRGPDTALKLIEFKFIKDDIRAALLSQHEQDWLQHVAQLEQKTHLLQILKQGVELFLLVSSYLIYYFLDCIAVVMAMPLPLVR